MLPVAPKVRGKKYHGQPVVCHDRENWDNVVIWERQEKKGGEGGAKGGRRTTQAHQHIMYTPSTWNITPPPLPTVALTEKKLSKSEKGHQDCKQLNVNSTYLWRATKSAVTEMSNSISLKRGSKCESRSVSLFRYMEAPRVHHSSHLTLQQAEN